MRSLHQGEGIPAASKVTALSNSRQLVDTAARKHPDPVTTGTLIYHCMPFALWYGRKAQTLDTGSGGFRTVSNVATLSAQKAVEGLLASSSDINASVLDDTVVQQNCSLHIRGNLLGNLTIESGAKVVVEGWSTEKS